MLKICDFRFLILVVSSPFSVFGSQILILKHRLTQIDTDFKLLLFLFLLNSSFCVGYSIFVFYDVVLCAQKFLPSGAWE
jgi:hypothetical protein